MTPEDFLSEREPASEPHALGVSVGIQAGPSSCSVGTPTAVVPTVVPQGSEATRIPAVGIQWICR